MINALSKAGLENFSQYGKLIGTGKNNGIKVYEKLANGERVLTGVKDDAVRKEVTKVGHKVIVNNKADGSVATIHKYDDEFTLRREKDGVVECLERKVNNGKVKGSYSKYKVSGDADILDLRVAQEPHTLGRTITIKSDSGIELGGQTIPKYDNHKFLIREYNGEDIFDRELASRPQTLDKNLAEAIWNAFSKLLS